MLTHSVHTFPFHDDFREIQNNNNNNNKKKQKKKQVPVLDKFRFCSTDL